MAKTNVTFTNFAAKKLLGKAQTRPSFTDAQEAYPSQVSMPGGGVFAETLPREPGTEFYVQYSASDGSPATVERVYFDVVAIGDGLYDADSDSSEGGEAGQNSTNHAFYLQLPSTYQTTSSNPNRGTGSFVNGAKLYESRGALQIVPPFTTDAGLPGAGGNNRFYVEVFSGDPSNPASVIGPSDPSDWYFDYYSGILFIQDSASAAPVSASAYLYTGKYLDTKLTDLSSSIGEGGGSAITVKDEGSSLSTAAVSFDFVGTGVTATNSSNNITVTIPGGINYARTAVTSTITSSTSARILGVSASAALDIRLPAASGFSDGQYFTIKDEAGNASTYNITIRASGADKIDGVSSIVLESPHAAVNLYTNGSDKFFIY